MKILFIDDEPENIRPALNLLREDMHDCHVKDFADAKIAINEINPDIVVLDIFFGAPANHDTAGDSTYKWIWEHRFCPIIIYSANPEEILDNEPPHPFVKGEKKGSRSPEKVRKAVKSFASQVEALKTAEKEIGKQFSIAMKEIAPHVFEVYKGPTKEAKRIDMIVRGGRRRVAALMDMQTGDQKIASWEQYLCPPVSRDFKLGDVLKKKDSPPVEPSSFCVVLTPSCDLVAAGGRAPKVDKVLVANCCTIKKGIQGTRFSTISPNKLKERLKESLLTPGYIEDILLFPGLSEKIPPMVADMKNLSLIPFAQLCGEKPEYERISSIDSPFRELVAWAYMQVACRLGLPDRDLSSWEEEVLAEYSK